MKLFRFSFCLFLLISFVSVSFAQDKVMPPKGEIYHSLTGNQNDPQLTSVAPAPKEQSATEKKVVNELRQARLSGNMMRQEKALKDFNAYYNTPMVTSPSDPNIQCSGPVNRPMGMESDYQMSTVAGLQHWNTGVATVPVGAPNAGRLYVATGQTGTTADSCKIYYSTNGGVSWVFYTQWWITGGNYDFRASEMDVQILYDGTAAYLYGVTPYTDAAAGNNVRVVLWRFNLTTNAFYGIIMAWPGAVATNLYYNARLAADDVIYTSGAFLYITASFDSTTGATHHLRQKYATIGNPFAATPTVTYPQATGGGFFWNGSGYPANAYYFNDVCFYNTGAADRVYTLISVNITFNNLYLAWSDTYGSTIAGSLQITIANPTDGSSLASVNASGNQTMMIVDKRHFSGVDWDTEYWYTTTGGTTTGAWSTGYIDFSGDRTSGYPDVTWVRGTTNNFKAAYTRDSASVVRGFYAGWNGTAWAAPSRMAPTNIITDSTWSTPVAGYRNGGGDNCVLIWSGLQVGVINASYLCATTVGVEGQGNEIPQSYSLSQNYPNPFNPMTNIRFAIPNSGLVKLVVYDMMGREVKTLVNQSMGAGNYTVDFDASDLSSGVYVYTIKAGDFTDTKKMVLVK